MALEDLVVLEGAVYPIVPSSKALVIEKSLGELQRLNRLYAFTSIEQDIALTRHIDQCSQAKGQTVEELFGSKWHEFIPTRDDLIKSLPLKVIYFAKLFN